MSQTWYIRPVRFGCTSYQPARAALCDRFCNRRCFPDICQLGVPTRLIADRRDRENGSGGMSRNSRPKTREMLASTPAAVTTKKMSPACSLFVSPLVLRSKVAWKLLEVYPVQMEIARSSVKLPPARITLGYAVRQREVQASVRLPRTCPNTSCDGCIGLVWRGGMICPELNISFNGSF